MRPWSRGPRWITRRAEEGVLGFAQGIPSAGPGTRTARATPHCPTSGDQSKFTAPALAQPAATEAKVQPSSLEVMSRRAEGLTRLAQVLQKSRFGVTRGCQKQKIHILALTTGKRTVLANFAARSNGLWYCWEKANRPGCARPVRPTATPRQWVGCGLPQGGIVFRSRCSWQDSPRSRSSSRTRSRRYCHHRRR